MTPSEFGALLYDVCGHAVGGLNMSPTGDIPRFQEAVDAYATAMAERDAALAALRQLQADQANSAEHPVLVQAVRMEADRDAAYAENRKLRETLTAARGALADLVCHGDHHDVDTLVEVDAVLKTEPVEARNEKAHAAGQELKAFLDTIPVCEMNPYSSAVCSLGTEGCARDHSKGPAAVAAFEAALDKVKREFPA